MRLLVAGVLSVATSAVAGQPVPLPSPFQPQAFQAHVTFLADDALEGRMTGSHGHVIAARYVAAAFTAAGLRPAGTDGSWYQPVPLREARLVPGSASVMIGSRRFANGDSVMIGPSLLAQKQNITADVVFAGHCLFEPRLNLDDFRGLDINGKIVACLRGFPAGLPSEVAAHLSVEKSRFIAQRGGIGQIAIHTPAREKIRPFARDFVVWTGPQLQLMNADGSVHQPAPGMLVNALVSSTAAQALFARAPRSLAEIGEAGEKAPVKGFPLNARMTVSRESNWRQIESPNVVGLVKGTDPKLTSEVVILGSHLDHLGRGEPVDGDGIYNGAIDNAGGTAALIEVAKATAAAPFKRSIIFLATTGEEQSGHPGADYYASRPSVPANSIIAMVNLDAPVLTSDFTDVNAYGADHGSVGEYVEQAAVEARVSVSPDPMPARATFIGSDTYPFITRGIVAVRINTGFGNGGKQAWADYLANHYHKPTDDLSQPIRWATGAKFADLAWRLVKRIADSPRRPRWYRGDYFGDAFAKDSPKIDRPSGE